MSTTTHTPRYRANFPKIDVFVRTKGHGERYLHSTNWYATCREAVAAAVKYTGASRGDLFARFDTQRKSRNG